VVWLEDRTGAIEIVVWNDVFITVSELLEPGRVVEVRGTIDTRGDSLRATAQKVRVPAANKSNGSTSGNGNGSPVDEPAVLLQFSRATTSEELREVRELLANSPGQRRVQLLFDRPNDEPLRVDAGADLRVNLTRELEEKLTRWLVTTKSERRGQIAL
ncbi:MAG TPA: OB-fold nucleic acid binding domain-containing protein, partial [Chthoniobacterales bacterium]|nr:OB-fold nucleic acid binding domain-containing protein [Chthoniobacterales bacterium]